MPVKDPQRIGAVVAVNADSEDSVGVGQVVCFGGVESLGVHQRGNSGRFHATPSDFFDPNGCRCILVQEKAKARVDFLSVELALPARVPWRRIEPRLLAVPDERIRPGFFEGGEFLACQLP